MPPPKTKPKPKTKEVEVKVKIDLLEGYNLNQIGLSAQPIVRNSFCTCAFCLK